LPVVAISLIALSVLSTGCDTKTDKGTISASSFGAAQVSQGGVRPISTKLDLLRAILPNERDSALTQLPAEGLPLRRIANFLLTLFETRNGAFCSVDLCTNCAAGTRSEVRLHYNRIGLEEELAAAGAVQPVISTDVPPLLLQSGWMLAFEEQSRSLVAFKHEEDYRQTPVRDENHPNFGRGNGLVLSLVLSGVDMRTQLQTESIPRITRMVELADGRIMLFFQEIFREVHLLRVNEIQEAVDFDLADPDGSPASNRLYGMLRGTLLPQNAPLGTRPDPVLTFDEILDVTQGLFLDIDSFQPVRIPNSHSALVYDTVQSMFLRFTVNPESNNGTATVAAPPSAVTAALLTPIGPFEMTHAWNHPSRNEILILEERTNTILAWNYQVNLATNSLRTAVPSVSLVTDRRVLDGAGGIIPGGGSEPEFTPAANDLRNVSQRLLFDKGRDELITISYQNDVVVISGSREQFSEITGEALVDLTFLEVVGAATGFQSVRAWDTESSTLLELLIGFTNLPDVTNQ